MEEYTPEQSKKTKSEEVKRWFQDNLRIIISVVIVILIAGGIYSYSKRSMSPLVNNELTENIAGIDQNQADVSDQSINKGTTASTKSIVSVASSKETESSFIETAGKGDGLTVLARRSLANYLEKNPDSVLTKEHKIYIEDYLRKNVGHKGGVHIGTSVEFSKDLIQKAIAQSKNLNEKQLKNLQKYSARVSSLS
jgi:uncharacterized protein YneF (UPF0154 family)